MCAICGAFYQTHEDGLISTETYVTTSTKPTATLAQATTYLTTQWPGQVGTTRTWQGDTVLTYAIPTTSPEPGSQESGGFVQMTAAMKAAAREAFELWDDLIAIRMDEVTTAPHDISFAYSTATINGGNYARTYSSYTGTSDLALTRAHIWLNAATTSHDTDSDLFYGGYARLTYVHEVGHTLGLSHPGVYDASLGPVTYASGALFAQDTRQYTVMSYFQANSDGGGARHVGSDGRIAYAATPLLYDIVAIQAKYGADMTTRTGNTTYGFNSNAGRAAFDFAVNKNPVVAIWDAGGNDTLDVSGFTQNQRVTLVAGAFSDVGAMKKNVAIAFGVTIENLVGGSGSDLLEGNQAANVIRGGAGADTIYGGAGNDTLYGDAGDDVLYGQAGADVFVFGAATGKDRIADFQVGIDRIRFEGSGAPTALSALTLTNQSGGVLVGWGSAGASVFLAGVTAAQLGAADFSFTATSTPTPVPPSTGGVVLTGGSGKDSLVGGTGNDTLYGLDGNDVLEGGAGADLLDGGPGFDTATYAKAPAAVSIHLATGSHTGVAQGDRFVSIERWVLTAFSDRFVGTGAVEAVEGGAGNDTLIGGGGNDKLTGGSGADVFLFGTAKGAATITDFEVGVDKIRIDAPGIASFSDLRLINETAGVRIDWGLAGVSVLLSGRASSQLKATDFLFGPETTTPSTDGSGLVLTGDASRNSLVGGSGNDTLFGMDGNDTLEGGRGADHLDGGAGFDVATYHRASAPVTVNLQTGAHGGEAAGDTFESIEAWTLSAFNDVFVGTAGTELVRAGAGDDRIFGGGGGDKLYGEAGADTFVFGSAKGAASVMDFQPGVDKIEIQSAGVTAFSQLALVNEASGVRVSWGVSGASVLVSGLTRAQLSASDFVFSSGSSAPAKDAGGLLSNFSDWSFDPLGGGAGEPDPDAETVAYGDGAFDDSLSHLFGVGSENDWLLV
jgi:serralysin